MNVDLNALSLAVRLAATNSSSSAGIALTTASSGDVKLKRDAPASRLMVRRRSKGSGSSNALQFLEAAHRSWTFAQEDLPSGEGALERRKSSRSKLNGEICHKSWTSGEQPKPVPEDESICSATIFVTRSSETLLPSCKSHETRPVIKSGKRRASIAGSIATHSPTKRKEAEEEEEEEEASLNGEGPTTSKKNGVKLARRSSFQVGKNNKNQCKRLVADVDPKTCAVGKEEAAGSPPSRPSGLQSRGKMTRRNTIQSISNVDQYKPSPQTQSPKHRRRSSKQNQVAPASRSVRFELDRKNRIKRHVIYIRSQTSYRTDTRALWWSEEDLDRIYQRENSVYEKFSNDRNYKKAIRLLWGSCSKAGSVPPDAKIISHVAGALPRGLEVDVLETVRDRRARVISSVLDAQESLREFDPAIRAKLLSVRYKNQCKAATKFAQKMGEGDALEAAIAYGN